MRSRRKFSRWVETGGVGALVNYAWKGVCRRRAPIEKSYLKGPLRSFVRTEKIIEENCWWRHQFKLFQKDLWIKTNKTKNSQVKRQGTDPLFEHWPHTSTNASNDRCLPFTVQVLVSLSIHSVCSVVSKAQKNSASWLNTARVCIGRSMFMTRYIDLQFDEFWTAFRPRFISESISCACARHCHILLPWIGYYLVRAIPFSNIPCNTRLAERMLSGCSPRLSAVGKIGPAVSLVRPASSFHIG